MLTAVDAYLAATTHHAHRLTRSDIIYATPLRIMLLYFYKQTTGEDRATAISNNDRMWSWRLLSWPVDNIQHERPLHSGHVAFHSSRTRRTSVHLVPTTKRHHVKDIISYTRTRSKQGNFFLSSFLLSITAHLEANPTGYDYLLLLTR